MVIESRESPTDGRCRVALDHNQIRILVGDDRFQSAQDPPACLRERLSFAHRTKIMIGLDGEYIEYLIEQVAVLSSHAHSSLKTRLIKLQASDDRSELNRLGPRTENQKDSAHAGLALF